jgi:hypothetical protein
LNQLECSVDEFGVSLFHTGPAYEFDQKLLVPPDPNDLRV